MFSISSIFCAHCRLITSSCSCLPLLSCFLSPILPSLSSCIYWAWLHSIPKQQPGVIVPFSLIWVLISSSFLSCLFNLVHKDFIAVSLDSVDASSRGLTLTVEPLVGELSGEPLSLSMLHISGAALAAPVAQSCCSSPSGTLFLLLALLFVLILCSFFLAVFLKSPLTFTLIIKSFCEDKLLFLITFEVLWCVCSQVHPPSYRANCKMALIVSPSDVRRGLWTQRIWKHAYCSHCVYLSQEC